ncbi:hypothetical protein [Caldalkalibacillus salinus]|uniref:hypothetical protein n=1 Tax=Caldalkalibacillus salinus TaxID=2803787 RepID=UPI0019235731|nr:hypothetical protein [Caldalkalibacillus salinus]
MDFVKILDHLIRRSKGYRLLLMIVTVFAFTLLYFIVDGSLFGIYDFYMIYFKDYIFITVILPIYLAWMGGLWSYFQRITVLTRFTRINNLLKSVIKVYMLVTFRFVMLIHIPLFTIGMATLFFNNRGQGGIDFIIFILTGVTLQFLGFMIIALVYTCVVLRVNRRALATFVTFCLITSLNVIDMLFYGSSVPSIDKIMFMRYKDMNQVGIFTIADGFIYFIFFILLLVLIKLIKLVLNHADFAGRVSNESDK